MFDANGDSLPGPLIMGPFEKRAPGALSIQQTFRFAIVEILRAQWNGLTSSNFIFAQ